MPAHDRSYQMIQDSHIEREDTEVPVKPLLDQGAVASLKKDLENVKRELSQDLRSVQKDLAEIGDRVSTLEENASGTDEQLEILQQELICLKEQHVDLQAHAEDLQNRLRRNNIHIRGVSTPTEGNDIGSYVKALFTQTEADVQLDRVHRVGLPRLPSSCLADILVCVHDFPVKE
ncbi:hypothetical protein NDU88_008114 [Pleurodeles waltl]|uniref:Uncharacterized protein n=1 Tax=Pleurodeles waltl TaxID=8319 RepID=A0AAV7QMM1_PLEWA|nr:hypothetical protein NDU88_008114 [Pleurodeles waltl]